jgi:hypothetical protein
MFYIMQGDKKQGHADEDLRFPVQRLVGVSPAFWIEIDNLENASFHRPTAEEEGNGRCANRKVSWMRCAIPVRL